MKWRQLTRDSRSNHINYSVTEEEMRTMAINRPRVAGTNANLPRRLLGIPLVAELASMKIAKPTAKNRAASAVSIML